MANLRRKRFSPFSLLFLAILLCIGSLGYLTLYSTAQGEMSKGMQVHQKQAMWWGFGLAGMLVLVWIDSRHLQNYAYLIYGASLLLLVYVLVAGRSIAGARRWIEIGPVQFQPSELMKLTLVLALAKYFRNHPKDRDYRLRDLKGGFLILLVPFILVMLEPDLGTAIILFLVFFSIVLFLGLKRNALLLLALVGLMSLPVGWLSLKDYQKDRVHAFLAPARDPLGTGYHLNQSKIAIGSGGFLGKGFMKGTQARLHFLPEQHTDFIFSAFVEERGFVGSAFLLGCYLVVIFCAMNVSSQAKDRFGMITALGVCLLIFWHVFINVGMCLGIMPVVGIPLPLFSYGGSFLLMVFLGVGLLLNTYLHRFIF